MAGGPWSANGEPRFANHEWRTANREWRTANSEQREVSTVPQWTADRRPDAASLLAKLNESDRARLRVYIGAAPGVGKTYQMLEDAHQLRRQGVDVVIGY